LVTGGAKRLGREFCLAFDRAGWDVACHYHASLAEAQETQHMVQALGVDCLLVKQDLSAPNAHEHLLSSIASHSTPRCIVNNASVFDEDDAFSSTSQHLQTHFQINTALPLLLGNALAQWAQKHRMANGWCSIIHVLDQKVHNLNPDYFSYTVSKLALERSVALQAQALAPMVRVCGLSPGLIYLSGPQSQDNFDQASQVNLLKHPVSPQDVARTGVFMAETGSLTGCTLQVDNGQHLVPLSRDVMFTITTPTS
jgi:NAD(P)-dependent dehydrogenase (short-subunit alcohol dehydrogenase family)